MDKKFLASLLIGGLIIRIIFSLALPPFTGNDEPAHVRYISHIRKEYSLPNANKYKENMAGNEYFQPPLFYILAAAVTRLSNNLYFLRIGLVSLSWPLTFLFAWKLLNKFQLPPYLKLSSIIFFSLLPSFIATSSTVNNDSLLVLFTLFALNFILSSFDSKISPLKIAAFALLSALAVLTKVSGIIVVVSTVVFILVNKSGKKKFSLTLYLLLLGILTSWWVVYNIFIYRHPLGPINDSITALNQLPWSFYKIFLVIRGVFSTFWSSYGPANEIRLGIPVYLLLLLLTSFSLLTGLYSMYGKRLKPLTLFGNKKNSLIIYSSLISNLFVFLFFNHLQLQPLARYFFPSLLPISVLILFCSQLPKALNKYLPLALLILMLLLNFLGLNLILNYNWQQSAENIRL